LAAPALVTAVWLVPNRRGHIKNHGSLASPGIAERKDGSDARLFAAATRAAWSSCQT
jgi:hypothetical protein